MFPRHAWEFRHASLQPAAIFKPLSFFVISWNMRLLGIIANCISLTSSLPHGVFSALLYLFDMAPPIFFSLTCTTAG